MVETLLLHDRSLTHPLTHLLTHRFTHSPTHSSVHSPTHSPIYSPQCLQRAMHSRVVWNRRRNFLVFLASIGTFGIPPPNIGSPATSELTVSPNRIMISQPASKLCASQPTSQLRSTIPTSQLIGTHSSLYTDTNFTGSVQCSSDGFSCIDYCQCGCGCGDTGEEVPIVQSRSTTDAVVAVRDSQCGEDLSSSPLLVRQNYVSSSLSSSSSSSSNRNSTSNSSSNLCCSGTQEVSFTSSQPTSSLTREKSSSTSNMFNDVTQCSTIEYEISVADSGEFLVQGLCTVNERECGADERTPTSPFVVSLLAQPNLYQRVTRFL